jgi:hypothetical protein
LARCQRAHQDDTVGRLMGKTTHIQPLFFSGFALYSYLDLCKTEQVTSRVCWI